MNTRLSKRRVSALNHLCTTLTLLVLVFCVALVSLGFATAAPQPSAGEFPAREVTFGFPTLEWEVANPSFEGNPFDLIAYVDFVHEQSSTTHRTEMFYAGEDSWRFRFTGTQLGEWRFETTSDDPELSGLRGRVTVVENPDPLAQGFLAAQGSKFAVPVGPGGERMRGVLYDVYLTQGGIAVSDLPREETELVRRVDEMLDETEANGFASVFLTVYNSWFELDAPSYDQHDSENPDPETFRLLETLITRAHQRGMFVHIWLWGDESRRQTPIGVGGINGEPDRRLQRYIAARLGPLPGWTMSYGFDLEEWVTPEAVMEWVTFLNKRFGWPHLLMARELGEGNEGYVFKLEEPWLELYATDDRPESDFYELARKRFEERDRPVFFERRFVYTRDDVWDMDTTRRALWQFAMAGGAGAVWGVMEWRDGPSYSEPGQLRTHARFWRERFLTSLEPREDLGSALALADPDLEHPVFYAENVSELRLDLRETSGTLRAVAVDTRSESYEEVDLGQLEAAEIVWRAPYQSDWAVAVGFDSE